MGLTTLMVGVPEPTFSVSMFVEGVPGLTIQFDAGPGKAAGAVSPNMSVPTVKLPSSVTIVSAVISKVPKLAIASAALGIVSQLLGAAQLPPALLLHVDAEAVECSTNSWCNETTIAQQRPMTNCAGSFRSPSKSAKHYPGPAGAN